MMKMKNIKAIFRRGQAQASSKSEQGQLQGQIREDLSRSSSVTNLNADHKNKGAFSKLRKSASKDRLDKLSDKKNDKKGIPSNNNKLDSGEVDHSLDSLQEIEHLQRQLTEMAKEKSELALELGERKGELQILKNEIVKLKMFQEQSSARIEQLNDENTSLRNRLRDVAHSPLSDNEKQQLLLESHRHSSAPASIATNVSLLEDGTIGDITACPTPDWDKHSSSNVSEVSVACLQDKINQMQETHYSTNEELQATLQELTDLQRQLTELQQDNERLLDEKNLMFDSLCRQTERLNDARAEVESLKQLLYRDKDETGQFESIVDREQKLVDLLKSAQEEREALLVKQEQFNNELQDARAANIEQITEIEQLTERVRTLESTLDAKHAEHRQLDQELAIAKDQCSGRQIEINRLTDLLENARTKINELEQERALNDKSELDELLDNARKEKDALESEVANLKEQVARSRNETEKLREQVSILQEECKVTRNNAKCTQSELEYKCEKLAAEKNNLNDQLQQLQDAANELQVQAQCQLEDKRQLSAVLSETQRNLSEAERKNTDLDNEVDDLKRLRKEENEEWEKFQNDLLTSVRVANDFKSEAQQELQKMILENKAHRERVRQLEAQIDKLKGSQHEEPSACHTSDNLGTQTIEDATLTASAAASNQDLSENTKKKSIFPLPFIHKANADPKKSCSKSDKSSNVSDEPESTKKSKFLPLLPKTKNKSETKHEEAQHLDRYADSSKIINGTQQEPVKKRKDAKKAPEKRLSNQEEVDLALLENLYSQIDPNLPEEQLTTDQKFIIKVKDTFDADTSPKAKPVAKKPKDKLAISKPLLDSVLNNPKLKEITEDSNVVQVEADVSPDIADSYGFSSEFKEFVSSDPVFSKRYEMVLKPDAKFDDLFHSNLEFSYYDRARPKSVSSFKPELLMTKSKSWDNVYLKQYVSDIELDKPYESTHSVTGLSNEEESGTGSVTDKSFQWENVTPDSLDLLYAKIDPNAAEDQLTKEEKFIIRLKKSLDEMGRKNTLKKVAKRRKKLKITQPTESSILQNSKLVTIMNNPCAKTTEPNTVSQVNMKQSRGTKLFRKKSNSFGDLRSFKLDESAVFKIPRPKLTSSSHPDLSQTNQASETEPLKSGRYQKSQLETKSGQFYRVKRAYDLQILRPTEDARKVSINFDPESDTDVISFLEDALPSDVKARDSQENATSNSKYMIAESEEEHLAEPETERVKDESARVESFTHREPLLVFKDLREHEIDKLPAQSENLEEPYTEEIKNEDLHSVLELEKVLKEPQKGTQLRNLVVKVKNENLKSGKTDTGVSAEQQRAEPKMKKNSDLEPFSEFKEPKTERNENSDSSKSRDPTKFEIVFDSILPRLSDSPSEEDMLDSLWSTLDDTEFELIQRIKNDPEYSRPSSDINEEDLKLIAEAQRKYSLEVSDDEFLDVMESRGVSSLQEGETVECINSNVNTTDEEKIVSSSKLEDCLSSKVSPKVPPLPPKASPVPPKMRSASLAVQNSFDRDLTNRRSFDERCLREPIYANYSTFLKNMIHGDSKEEGEKLVKKPLPLPRSKSMTETNPEGDPKGADQSDSQSKSFDSSVSKITSDISNLTSSLDQFNEARPVQNMISDISEGQQRSTHVKVFGNIEKYYATHPTNEQKTPTEAPQKVDTDLSTSKDEDPSGRHELEILTRSERFSQEDDESTESILDRIRWKTTTDTCTETDDVKPKNDTHDTNTQTVQEDGFSILNIFDKIGHIINDKLNSVTSKRTTTISTGTALDDSIEGSEIKPRSKYVPEIVAVQDDVTQTSMPVIIEHHLRDASRKQSEDLEEHNSSYETLERVAVFHALNNPPKPMDNFHIQSARSVPQPASSRSSFEYAKNKFETLSQASQKQYPFKSETMKRVTMTRSSRVTADFTSKGTAKSEPGPSFK